MRSLGRPRILVCDDEETVRLICERALTRAGYQAHVFATGRAALDAVRRESYDAFVLDVGMLGLDGPHVLAELRTHDPDAPCLVISGTADFEAAIALLRTGASELMKKPFDVADLVAGVDRVLASTHLRVDSALLAATQTISASLDAQTIASRVLGVVRSLLKAAPAVLILGDGPARVHRLDDSGVTTVRGILWPWCCSTSASPCRPPTSSRTRSAS